MDFNKKSKNPLKGREDVYRHNQRGPSLMPQPTPQIQAGLFEGAGERRSWDGQGPELQIPIN
jgi:hypothetical protein